jgi:hypothetical protein
MGLVGGLLFFTLGCLVGYMDVTEGFRAMLGYPVFYLGVMEGSRACRVLVWVLGLHRGVQGHAGLIGVLHKGSLKDPGPCWGAR